MSLPKALRRLSILLVLALLWPGCGGTEPSDGEGDGDADTDGDGDEDTDGDGDTGGDAGEDAGVDGEADDGGEAEADADGDEPDEVDPAAAGPYTFAPVGHEISREGRVTPVQALLPDLPAGATGPLVLFLPGFQMRTAYYLPFLERLASHGFVVVRADPPSSLFDNDHVAMALDGQAVLDWALDASGPLGPSVDAAHVATSGHSNGGKIATMIAFADPRVTAILGLDPVNGAGPFGYTEERPDIVPEMVEPLAIPMGFFGERVDATAGIGGQACAPADQSFQTFYDAATSSPWVAAWEIPGASHVDFVFDRSACGLLCSVCRDGEAEPAEVHGVVMTLGVAFLRLHFFGEAAMERWLTGDLVPESLVVQHRGS